MGPTDLKVPRAPQILPISELLVTDQGMREEVDLQRLQSRTLYYAKQLGVHDSFLGITVLSACDGGYTGSGALRCRILPVQVP